jgi:hypothetical protein
MLGGAAARRSVRVSKTFSDAFLSFLRQVRCSPFIVIYLLRFFVI